MERINVSFHSTNVIPDSVCRATFAISYSALGIGLLSAVWKVLPYVLQSLLRRYLKMERLW